MAYKTGYMCAPLVGQDGGVLCWIDMSTGRGGGGGGCGVVGLG